MRSQRTANSSELLRPFVVVIAVAVAMPVALGVLSAITLVLLFYLETVLIGAYPFLGTIRVNDSTWTYFVVSPFNWFLTTAQWGAIALIFALQVRAKGLLDDPKGQIILACALWFAINVTVRLAFWLFGLKFELGRFYT